MLILQFHFLKETFTFLSRLSLRFIFPLLLVSSTAFATDDTGPDEVSIDLIGRMSAAAHDTGINVSKQLDCIKELAEPGSTYTRSLSLQNYLLLAPHLKEKFEKYKIGPLQRALFYSQIIHESQQFSRLSEVSSSGMQACWNKINGQKGSPCGNSIGCMILDDLAFREDKPWLEKFRGRGLIHITGCDTYVSALHFHNTGKWRAYWPVSSAAPSNCPERRCPSGQLGMDCSAENITEIKSWYQSTFGMPLDKFDVLNAPSKLSYTCNPANTSLENPGNEFIVDSSFAFWKGKCTDHRSAVPDALNKIKVLGPIQGFSSLSAQEKKARVEQLKNNNQIDQAINMVSQCVNGGANGLADRKKWFLRALQCVH